MNPSRRSARTLTGLESVEGFGGARDGGEGKDVAGRINDLPRPADSFIRLELF
jgi:hypothetical protein